MLRILSAIGIAAASLATPVLAVPILNPGNGHYYEFVPGQVTWQTALSTAATNSYLGNQGYLATVTSAQESNFIFNSVSSVGNWFSGTDEDVEGVWKWVAGPEAGTVFWNGGIGGSAPTYANWNPGSEPNNCCGPFGEDYLHNFSGSAFWNDLQPDNLGFIEGYVVEYGGLAAVPEPASWALMLAGFGIVGAAARRRANVRVSFS
jgi:PEP-CTERM motif/Lectin C-type domain